MSHDLFTDVVSPTVRVRSSSRYTIAVSIAAHALIVAAVIIVPLMATGALPTPATSALAFMPAAPLPSPPAPPPTAAAPPRATPVPHDAAPIAAPEGIRDEEPIAPTGDTAPGAIALGPPSSGIPFGDVGAPTVVPPPPPPPTPPQKPLRQGGAIREPVKLKHVPPTYPPIALSARVSGSVVIDAVIGADGVVREARILRGVPLLNEAALEAVRQWRYTPTLLNGVPVPIIMTVTITFHQQ